MEPIKITYFSDALCIWAYVSQARLDEVEKTFGDQVQIEPRFCSVFGDTDGKITSVWKNRGGYSGFNTHLQEVAKDFPHIEINPEVWLTTRPASSTSVHLFMKAMHQMLHEQPNQTHQSARALYDKILNAFRIAFFRDGRDISRWDVQCEIAEPLGIDINIIEASIQSGEAFALLSADYHDAEKMQIAGSPTYVLNEGRQKLFGNVGFHLIEANIQELLRSPGEKKASWC